MPLTIRPLAPADRGRWEELFLAYGKFYKIELAPDVVERVWGWIFGGVEPFWCDVAADDTGRIVGIAQYQLMHRSLGGGMVLYFSDLYVDPDVRGQGVGRALIDRVIAAGREKGCPMVRWLTQEFNYKGRMLYDTYAPKSDFVLYSVKT